MIGISIGVFLLFQVVMVTGLESFDNFREGSCSEVQMKPLKNIKRDWLDTLKYIVGGNKYNLYRAAFHHHRYQTMADYEFYYDFCYLRNTSTEDGHSTLFGFGVNLGTYETHVPRSEPAVYLEELSENPLERWDVNRQWVTLTDNKSFAFVTLCYTGVDQKGWMVISSKPELDSQTQKRVEDHAISMGFLKEDFVFLRRDRCNNNNAYLKPVLKEADVDPYRGEGTQTAGRKLQATRANVKGPRESGIRRRFLGWSYNPTKAY